MTVASGNSQENLEPPTRLARQPVLRPFFRAAFWAALAYVSWTAFRIGQQRLQPDAIASSVPGFLSRLILRPLEALLHGMVSFDPGMLFLQGVVAATIWGAAMQAQRACRSLGGDRG